MSGLDNYRQVSIAIECPEADTPLEWDQWTTRTKEQLEAHAASVGRIVCKDLPYYHSDRHVITITELPVSTGAGRRG